MDPAGRFTAANAACQRICGYTAQELLALDFPQLCDPEQLGQVAVWFQEGLSGASQTRELAIVHKDGRRVELRVTAVPITTDGQVVGLYCMAEDITAHKRAEEELARTQDRLAHTLNSITEGYYALDGEWRFLRANRVAEAHFGQPAGALVGQNVWELTAAPADSPLRQRFEAARASGQPVHFEAASQFRPGCWSQLHLYPRNGEMDVYFSDISKRKRAEVALRQSEERLRHLGDNIPAGAIYQQTTQPDGSMHYAYMSAGIETISGMTAEQVRADPGTFRNLIAEEDRPRCAAAEAQSARNLTPFDCEFRQRTVAGQMKWVHCRSTPRRLADGSMVWDGVVTDITERKRAEEALQASKERLRLALEAGAMAAWDWHVPSGLTIWNEEHFRMMGYAPGAVTPGFQVWADRVHPDDLASIQELLQRSLDHGGDYCAEFRTLWPDGTVRWLEARGRVERNDAGQPLRCYGVMLDTTAHKQAENTLRESQERFRSVLENSLDAAYRRDLRTDAYDYLSPVMEQVMGLSPERMRNMPVQEMIERIHPEDRERVEQTIREAIRSHKGRVEYRFRLDDGQYRWMADHFTVQTAADGVPILRSGTVRDVTEQKQAEAALREANLQLAEADRRKDEFLAMLAHELRNPLAPVRNAVQILRAVGSKEVAAQRQQDVIDRQVTHMARLLDDLLDVSRVTRGKIALEQQPMPLIDVLAHAIEIATPLIQHRRHALTYGPPTDVLLIEGDPDRLAQVFGNLLTNAAKYTEAGGRIWLEATCEDGQVVVRVRDNGMGIASELLPRVFDLFSQADHSVGRAQGGLGIGLTMVQKLVQMHGGTVEARSAGLGQGSEFIVRLPALDAEPASEITVTTIPTQSSAGVVTARRVLIVDDITDSAESLAELLALWGHETQTAQSGATALDWARWFRPEVVLLDIGMPGMDGFEVARRLRQIPEMEGAVLVALTGYGQTQDHEATRAAGFNHHLVKPVDLKALRRLLESPPVV